MRQLFVTKDVATDEHACTPWRVEPRLAPGLDQLSPQACTRLATGSNSPSSQACTTLAPGLQQQGPQACTTLVPGLSSPSPEACTTLATGLQQKGAQACTTLAPGSNSPSPQACTTLAPGLQQQRSQACTRLAFAETPEERVENFEAVLEALSEIPSATVSVLLIRIHRWCRSVLQLPGGVTNALLQEDESALAEQVSWFLSCTFDSNTYM